MNEYNIHVLSRGVIIDQNHILLAYDPRLHPNHYYELNSQFYYLPGGHIEFQESAKTALIRELKEETGFGANIERFLGVLEHAWNFPGDDICCHTHEINLIFKVNIAGLKYGDAVSQQEEHVAFSWVPIENLEKTDFRPLPLKNSIIEWLKHDDNNVFHSTIK